MTTSPSNGPLVRRPRARALGPVLGVLLLAAGSACSAPRSDPAPPSAAGVEAELAPTDATTPSAPVLDLGPPTGQAGDAEAIVATPSSSISPVPPTPPPPPPPSSSPSTVAAPSGDSQPTVSVAGGAITTTSTTAPPPTSTTAPTTTGPATTAATRPQSTAPPTTVATAPVADGLVEFRIPPGTGRSAWNRFDDPVRVTVGQTLRIHNDDAVAHAAHSDGIPFAHGPSIPPGGFADHAVVAPLSPDPSAPITYDHDAGVAAPFWIVSTSAGGDAGTGRTDPLAEAEAESLRLLNDLRTGLGLQPVRPIDDEMHAFARAWSREMRETGFRHSDPPRWFENIVWYSDRTMTPTQAAGQFHQMWVDSPGHYRNMTNPEWSVVGVGMWHDETGWWGVHVFRPAG